MTTKTAKATLAIAVTVVAALVLGYAAMATAQSTTTTTTSTSNTSSSATGWQGPGQGYGRGQGGFQGGQGGPFGGQPPGQGGMNLQQQNQVSLTVGQTFTVTSSQGTYTEVGDSSVTGSATGTLTFSVTGKLSAGYTLSITGGSITIDGTTYTVSSGSAEMGPGASNLSGQGSLSSGGVFLIHASARGTFAGSTGFVNLDLQSGSTEYLVSFSGSVSS
ncbi:MAG TPA: hypothetical protein VEJ36_06655 [Nitrososphaerales archaeon]|nr:hypothetical protein [Nitrososphaerales archaeon]